MKVETLCPTPAQMETEQAEPWQTLPQRRGMAEAHRTREGDHMSKRSTALANLARAKAEQPDPLEALAAQSAAAEQSNPDAYRLAVHLLTTAKGADAETAADAAVYVGRQMLTNPQRDDEHTATYARRVAAYTLRNALRNTRRDDRNRDEREPAPVTLDALADDPAGPESDPQNRYRWTPAGLLAAAIPATLDALRTIELDPLPDAVRLPADRAEQATDERKSARYAATVEDTYRYPLPLLSTAQRAARLTAAWNRSGSDPTALGKSRPMVTRPALPSSGPASPVLRYRKNRTLATVDGLPWREAAALIGLPDAEPEQVAALAHRLRTHPQPDADAVPLAQVKHENAEDERAHQARQPVKKPNPRKRPRGGRIGSPATIR